MNDDREKISRGSCIASFPWITIWRIRPRRVRQLLVERLPVLDAARQEFRPGRHRRHRVRLLGQQAPELGVMPAEVVAGRIAVLADAGAEFLHLRDQLVAREFVEIGVHAQ